MTLPAGGLATDPSPLLTASQGGMRVADDVVVISDGAVVARPGFNGATGKTTTYRPHGMTVFGGEPLVVSRDGSAWRVERTGAVLTGAAEPPDTNISPTQWAEARASLYYTTIGGVRKIASPSASVTASAGLEMVVSTDGPGNGGGGSGPVIGTGIVAFRLVFVRRDANGYVIRSAPSQKFIFEPSLAGGGFFDWTTTPFSRVSIPSWIVAGDQIEVYRSRFSGSSTVPPSSELYLSQTYTVTSADVTNGYAVLNDDYTSDDTLGAALYTNPSQQGIAASKTAPPRAVALAYWNSCMWYGNTVEPYRATMRIVDAGIDTATSTGITRVFGLLAVTYTAGSPDITGVPSVTNVVPGMAISGTGSQSPATAGTYVPAGTYVGSISGAGPYTVSMVDALGNPVNALNSGSLQSVTFHDVIRVGGVEFYAANGQYTPGYVLDAERCFFVSISATMTERSLVDTAETLCRAVNMYATKNPSFLVRAYNLGDVGNPLGSYAPGSILFEEIGTTGASFSVQSVTKPNAVNPTTSSALTATRDVSPARLFWSDPDEPEAVPTVQFVDVGNQRDPILALVPLRGALLVFKKDGVFRVTGAPPDSWAVELLDGSTRLLTGSAVDVLDGRAFAFTSRGAVAVDEGGVQNVSERRIGRLLLESQRLADSGLLPAFVRAWPQAGVVAFGVEPGSDDDRVGGWYVYRPASGTWTRWAIPALTAAADMRGASFFYARPDMWELRSSTTALETTTSSGLDYTYALTGWTYASGTPSVTVTSVQRSTWEPKAGDYVSGDAGGVQQFRRVTEVQASGGDRILTLESAFSSTPIAPFFGYESIVSTLHWQGHSADPITSALYREVQVIIDATDSAVASPLDVRVVAGASTDRAATPRAVTALVSGASAPPTSLARVAMPRDAARATHVYPYAQISGIAVAWVCLGVGLVFEAASERTAR